jgi:hypothetical protein
MWAADDVTWIGHIDVHPLSLAFDSGEHRMNVEKRKAERLEAHKAEDVEI